MVKEFADVAEQYGDSDDGSKSSVRALQAWQYLIGKAKNRQLVKYGELAELMGYPTPNPLSPILGHIMYFCKENKLPALTVIVVNKSGIPGEGFTQLTKNQLNLGREKTFNHPWFSIYPPSPEEFKDAWDSNARG